MSQTQAVRIAGDRLPPLPAAAIRLLQALENDRTSFREIGRLINVDAAFTVEVLRLANSAVFARRFEVVSVMHALTVLGLERVRSLVLTVAMRDFLAPLARNELVRQCWRHNLAAALGAETLARDRWMDSSAAYTAGLLHDVGRLALVGTDPGVYGELVERSRREGVALPELEREAFGADSEQARDLLMEAWGLPGLLSGARCRQSVKEGPAEGTLRGMVWRACSLDCRAGFAIAPRAAQAPAPGDEELMDSVFLRLNLFECEFMQRA